MWCFNDLSKVRKYPLEITYPFSNFNGSNVEVWEWTSNLIVYFIMDVIAYPCWYLSYFMLVKGATGQLEVPNDKLPSGRWFVVARAGSWFTYIGDSIYAVTIHWTKIVLWVMFRKGNVLFVSITNPYFKNVFTLHLSLYTAELLQFACKGILI